MRSEVLAGSELIAGRGLRAPVDYLAWLPVQDGFLRDPRARVLLRSGNQLGKSTAGLSAVYWHCKGDHPFFEVPPPPVTWWVICVSAEQSIDIQRKLYELVPHDELADDTEFSRKRGFRGREAVCEFRNGSIIRFRSLCQGALRMSGATVNGVLIDEICPERIYQEALGRIRRTSGKLLLTLTPINGPVDWLQERVEDGEIADHHTRLSEYALTPRGRSEPLRTTTGEAMDEAWVAERIAEARTDAEVVCHGEWSSGEASRALAAWGPSCVSSESIRSGWPAQSPVRLVLVVDHGTQIAANTAWILLGYQLRPHANRYSRLAVRVLAEHQPRPGTDEQDDIESIDAMLSALGLDLESIEVAIGDHNNAGRSRGGRSLNSVYQDGFAEYMGLDASGPSFRFKRAQKGARSIDYGLKLVNNELRKGNLVVSASCPILIRACQRWEGRKDEHVHWIDCLRYGLTYLRRQAEGYRELRVAG